MWETKFYINGKLAKIDDVTAHWIASETYDMINPRVRDDILETAINGNGYGNHNPNGEIEILSDAGITLEQPPVGSSL